MQRVWKTCYSETNLQEVKMDQREVNCAATGVANRTVIAGQQMRENAGSRNGPRGRTTASLTFLGCLVMAGLLLVQRPLPARADDLQELQRGDRVKAETYALKLGHCASR